MSEVSRLVICYIGGILLANLLCLPIFGALSIAFFSIGLVMAMPLLLLVIFVFFTFRHLIRRNLGRACSAVPFVILPLWILILWWNEGMERNLSLSQFLTDYVPFEFVVIGILSAISSSLLFWFWERRRLEEN